MKALIVPSGYGLHLRPLTLTRPHQIIEFCNKPIFLHQAEALVAAGITHIILTVLDHADTLKTEIRQFEEQLGIKISILEEVNPLLSAGQLALAKELLLSDDASQPFFVLNYDAVCDFPFKEMLEFHKKHSREGTIVVKKVEEPSKYDAIAFDESSGRIDRLVMTPQQYVGDKINAGLYIFNTSILNRVQVKVSILEREVFSAMAAEGELYAFVLQGFWMNVGQPKDFLTGCKLYLQYLKEKQPDKLTVSLADCVIEGDVIVDPDAKIGKGCRIGPNVVVGPGVNIGDGVRLKNTTILMDSKLRSYSCVINCIVGWCCDIGKWVNLKNCVIGENAKVKDNVSLNESKVLPDTSVSEDISESAGPSGVSPPRSASKASTKSAHSISSSSDLVSEESTNKSSATPPIQLVNRSTSTTSMNPSAAVSPFNEQENANGGEENDGGHNGEEENHGGDNGDHDAGNVV